MQGLMLVATIAGGYAVVKNQLARVIQDLVKINDELENVNKRLDVAESSTAVFQHQITVLGHILSPVELEKQHREIADVQARIKVAEGRIASLSSMHNSKHPRVSE
jgi:septal ring factor EnvC (AmiA/AmiB activator)|tara:strand:+ start:104 stop:421 length:318 start_codon:yes stop_codon:yes gene_type:complete